MVDLDSSLDIVTVARGSRQRDMLAEVDRKASIGMVHSEGYAGLVVAQYLAWQALVDASCT